MVFAGDKMRAGSNVLTINKNSVSAFPLSLPSLENGHMVDYAKRNSSYYSHLAALAASEISDSIAGRDNFFYSYGLTAALSASLLHAANMHVHGNGSNGNTHPYSAFMQSAIRASFKKDVSGEDYIPALISLEEAFSEPEAYKTRAKQRMRKFAEAFSRGICDFVIKEGTPSERWMKQTTDYAAKEPPVVKPQKNCHNIGLNGSNGHSDRAYGDMPAELKAAWESTRPRLYFHVASLVRNEQDTEEIVQDTFLRAIRGFSNFRGDSSVDTWLFTIAANLARNRYHYWRRRRRDVSESLDGAGYDVISTQPSPRHNAEQSEFESRVDVALEKLPARFRDILHLRIKLHKPYDQIAVELGMNIGTVKSRLARARQSLIGVLNDGKNNHDVFNGAERVAAGEAPDDLRIAPNEQHWEDR